MFFYPALSIESACSCVAPGQRLRHALYLIFLRVIPAFQKARCTVLPSVLGLAIASPLRGLRCRDGVEMALE